MSEEKNIQNSHEDTNSDLSREDVSAIQKDPQQGEERKEQTVAEGTSDTVERTIDKTEGTSDKAGGTSDKAERTSDRTEETLNLSEETPNTMEKTTERVEETLDRAEEASKIEKKASDIEKGISDTVEETSRTAEGTSDTADKTSNTAEKISVDVEKTSGFESKEKTAGINKNTKLKRLIIHSICIIGFLIFTGLFINEAIIQPYRTRKAAELTRELFNRATPVPSQAIEEPEVTVTVAPDPTVAAAATPTPDPNRDEMGRLLQFKDLLAVNEDVKGWITIPDTNIDYVVMQSIEDPEYYLYKDINKEYSKSGSLFLDVHSSVEQNTKNLVIHGHNMVSTAEKMFHPLLQYKKISYYKEHPLITFDTIYNTGEWKIFAVFITNGDDKKDPLFDYMKSTFQDSSEFLNFVYQIRVRSVLNIDTVDINEDDQLLVLSTCSYEVDNYRTVIVARKVREGEDSAVDVDSVTKNPKPLYPESYYQKEGGKAPKTTSFDEALKAGEINWYQPAWIRMNRKDVE